MDTQEQIEVGSISFSELPDEILLNIFQHLSFKDLGRCCLLCQKFRQIASDKVDKQFLFIPFLKHFKQLLHIWIFCFYFQMNCSKDKTFETR